MFRPELDYDDTKGVEEGEEDVAERWVRVGYGGKMWLKGIGGRAERALNAKKIF